MPREPVDRALKLYQELLDVGPIDKDHCAVALGLTDRIVAIVRTMDPHDTRIYYEGARYLRTRAITRELARR